MPVTLAQKTGPVVVLGEITACEHLLITPCINEGRYTGAFALTHDLTGRCIQWCSDPDVLRRMAARLSHLDWSATDPQAYREGGGPALPGRPKIGDGSTYRWWLRQFDLLGYRHKVLYLNSMFFGVPQSRDRWYGAFWDRRLPTPDLEHRPVSWCDPCRQVVEAVWTWRTGVPPTGSVRYGKQYDYRCPRCRRQVIPPAAPSIDALDLSDLGTRIGDRTRPLAAATMARAERCRQRFPEFPAILMPAKAARGVERHPWQPMATQTSQQETAILSTGALLAAADHTCERPGSHCRSRGLDEPLWAQTGTVSTGVITPPVALAGHVMPAHRHNGDGKHITQPMDTVTATHEKAVLLAAVDNYQGAPRSAAEPLPTQCGSETLGLFSARVLPNRTNGTSRGLAEPMETLVGNAGSGGLGVLSTGVVPYRRHTVPTVQPCGKVIYVSRKAARRARGRVPGSWGPLCAYQCPHTEGWWHLGHLLDIETGRDNLRAAWADDTSRGG
ncbi:MAG: hypothetical protein ACREXJ_01520 [Gammaproteobacteria bacterium]